MLYSPIHLANLANLANNLTFLGGAKLANQIMTKTISATKASNNFGRMIDEAARGRSLFVVTRMGKPRAIVVGVDQYLELLEELEITQEQRDPEFQALLDKAREDIELGQTMTLDEFDEKFGFRDIELSTEESASDGQ